MNSLRNLKLNGLVPTHMVTRRSTIIALGLLTTAGVFWLSESQKLRLESSQGDQLTKTLSLPRTMIFSRQLKVLSSEAVNHDTKKITFALPGGEDEISGLPAGAAILTSHKPDDKWVPRFRPYTPIHDLETPGILQLLVKRYPNGIVSTHLHSLRPGDEITIRGPLPTYYAWKSSQEARDVVFIAGGAGITPIYSLARGVLNDPNDNTRIHLIWGVNSSKDVILKKEFAELKALAGDSLRISYFVSGEKGLAEIEEAKKSTSVPAEFQAGRVTEPALKGILEAIGGKDRLGDANGTKVFLCGPPAMEEALAGRKGILSQLGIPKKEVHQF